MTMADTFQLSLPFHILTKRRAEPSRNQKRHFGKRGITSCRKFLPNWNLPWLASRIRQRAEA
jgi:hypothetical protein